MPFILLVIALFAPRIIVALLWLLTTWFQGVFATLIWPILGFVFMPTTTFWYSAVHHWFGGEWTLIPLVGMIVSIVLDLSPTKYRRSSTRDV